MWAQNGCYLVNRLGFAFLTLSNSGKSRIISPDSTGCLGEAIKCPSYNIDLHVLTKEGTVTETISTRRCRTNLDDVSIRQFKARSLFIRKVLTNFIFGLKIKLLR